MKAGHVVSEESQLRANMCTHTPHHMHHPLRVGQLLHHELLTIMQELPRTWSLRGVLHQAPLHQGMQLLGVPGLPLLWPGYVAAEHRQCQAASGLVNRLLEGGGAVHGVVQRAAQGPDVTSCVVQLYTCLHIKQLRSTVRPSAVCLCVFLHRQCFIACLGQHMPCSSTPQIHQYCLVPAEVASSFQVCTCIAVLHAVYGARCLGSMTLRCGC
mmetsp:Transcript_17599/g.38007  ORF Transcript_17599/g.38007 Transcript_17599/m.38007 type:complete len:212 (-) Transcript_17599:209-844(-)